MTGPYVTYIMPRRKNKMPWGHSWRIDPNGTLRLIVAEIALDDENVRIWCTRPVTDKEHAAHNQPYDDFRKAVPGEIARNWTGQDDVDGE